MSLLRSSATGAIAAIAVVLVGPAMSADAAGKPHRFQTLASINGASVQACRLSSSASKPVKLKMRVDATKATSKVSGLGQATYNGDRVGKGWTSGWVRKGHRSSVGTVFVPRGAAYALMAGLGTGAMGEGGEFKVADIKTCR